MLTDEVDTNIKIIPIGGNKMIKILVICGTGVATSTMVKEKIREWLEKEKLIHQVSLFQSSVAEAVNQYDTYDIVISTTIVPDEMKDYVIDGTPFISGLGGEEMYQIIREKVFS